MKRKEIFKRLTAVSMSALMAVTMIPEVAFASDDGFFADASQEAAAATDSPESALSGGGGF